MGMRYRKSINLGLGFRINLSKSGIGYSWGVPGYRITKTATGATRKTYSLPGTGISYVETNQSHDNQTISEEDYRRLKSQLDEIYAGLDRCYKLAGIDEASLAKKSERDARINKAKEFILENSDLDERVFEAITIILDVKSASASMLSRRMRISFDEATQLLTQLEKLNMIGEHNGSKPRDIYVNNDNIADKVEAVAILISQTIEASLDSKPSSDEIGESYAEIFTDFFGCNVVYVRDADLYDDDDFYQLEFETSEIIRDIEKIEEQVCEYVSDIVKLAKYGPKVFQATIWLAPDNHSQGDDSVALIKCNKCGKTISDEAKYCPHCGSPVNPLVEPSEQIEDCTVTIRRENSSAYSLRKAKIYFDDEFLDEFKVNESAEYEVSNGNHTVEVFIGKKSIGTTQLFIDGSSDLTVKFVIKASGTAAFETTGVTKPGRTPTYAIPPSQASIVEIKKKESHSAINLFFWMFLLILVILGIWTFFDMFSGISFHYTISPG